MADIKNLELLKTQLEAQHPMDGRLTLIPDSVPDGDFLAFLMTLPQQQLTLEDPKITAAGSPAITRLDVTGDVYGNWIVPRLNGGTLSGIKVRISFLQNRATAPIVSTLAVAEATLLLANKAVSVTGGVLPTTTLLTLKLGQPGPTLPLLDTVSFLTGAAHNDVVPEGVALFNQIRVSGVEITFGFAASATTYFGVTTDVDGDWAIIDGGLFALKQIGVSLVAIYNAAKGDETRLSFSGNLHATTQLGGNDFDIILYMLGGGQMEFDVLPKHGRVLPALADLAGSIGGDGLKSLVNEGTKRIGLGDISVEYVRVGFDVARRKLLYVTVQGHITVAGGQLFVNVQLPEFMFYGGLPSAPKFLVGAAGVPVSAAGPASEISFKALASHVFGDAADLPDISITQLSLFAYPSQGSYHFEVLTEEEWKWNVAGKGGPYLVFESLGVNLDRSPEGVTGGLTVGASLGGFDVVFNAEYQGKNAGWLFIGTGGSEHGIPLGAFAQDVAKKIGATVPAALLQAVQGLEVNYVNVVFDTQTKEFQFSADITTTGSLPLGLKSYELELRAFLAFSVDTTTGQRSFTGHVEADLDIGKATFLLSYDFGPSVKTVLGRWRSTDGNTLSFNDMTSALGIEHSIAAPDGLDLGLKSASFEYHVVDEYFMLAAESALFGDAFFTAGKSQSGSFGFVFGVDFPAKARLSSLPVIGKQFKAADFITFKQAAILIASAQFKNYTLPALPPLPQPTPASSTVSVGRLTGGCAIKPVAAGAGLQLTQGVSLVAIMDLAASAGDARIRNIHSVAGKDELPLQVTISENGLSLFIELAGGVSIPAGGKTKLRVGNSALLITLATEVVFQLMGTISLSVNGSAIDATARLVIDESEAQVTVDVSGDHSGLPPPPGVKGLHLEEFGLAMGVFFEPPGVDLGIQGKLRIGETLGTKDDEFAIVFEMIEEVPNELYLSFYVDKCDLGQLVTLFTDQSAPDAVQSLEIVRLSDLGFHWSENVVVLPDGSIAQPGLGLSASMQILSFGGHVDLEMGLSTGIHGHAEMAPINLKNILQITGNGQGIKRTYQQINGQWQLINNNSIVRSKDAMPTRQEVIVPPGGPIIELNALHSPFVHVNWRVTLFDLVRNKVEVTISDKGFSFTLTYQAYGIEKFDLHATLKDIEHFEAGANFHFGIDARVGPIHILGIDSGSLHLVCRVDAAMSINLDPVKFRMDLTGGFTFEGLNFSIPTLTLSVAPASLKELPGKMLQQIKDHADQLFAPLFAEAQRWATMIGQGIVIGVTDMAHTLKNVYKSSAEDAARLMKVANQSGVTVASGLKSAYGLSSSAAITLMIHAGYSVDQVASGMKQAYGMSIEAVALALRQAGYGVNDVGNALKTAYGATAKVAASALKGAGFVVNETGEFVKNAYGLGARQLNNVLHGAGYAGDQIKGFFNSLGGSFADVFKDIADKLDPRHWF